MGYGKLLIAFSYELSKVEKKTGRLALDVLIMFIRLGSPEKPLSDLGLLSYRSYWADILIAILYDYPSGSMLSIQELVTITSFTPEDIMHTLTTLDVFKFYKGGYIICLSEKNIEYHEKNLKKKRRIIDPTKIVWTPPKFLPSQLRYL